MFQPGEPSASRGLFLITSPSMQAEDDPLALSNAIPEDAFRENPNCILAKTPAGGHLGWVRREEPFGAAL